MVGISNAIDIIGTVLKEEGWREVGKLFGRNANNAVIYARHGRNVVLFGPFHVAPNRFFDPNFPMDLQDEFEDYLRRVMRELEDHLHAVNPRELSIVFHGGGTLRIPDWFLDWCRERGVVVHLAPDPQESAAKHDGSLFEFILKLGKLMRDLREGVGGMFAEGRI